MAQFPPTVLITTDREILRLIRRADPARIRLEIMGLNPNRAVPSMYYYLVATGRTESTKTSSNNTTNNMLTSKCIIDMDCKDNQIPALSSSGMESDPDDDACIAYWWSQRETPFNCPPMPPLPLPQSIAGTPPPNIARSFSYLSESAMSQTLHEFPLTDLHLLDTSLLGVQPETMGLLPASVCLRTLYAPRDEQSSFGRQGDDAQSTGLLQNGDDEDISIAFSMEAEDEEAISRCDGWLRKYDLLQRYKAEHGDCDVPQKPSECRTVLNQKYEGLGIWVNKQRTQKTHRDEGRPSQITVDRLRLLNSIGFKWSEPRGQALWNIRLSELVEYKNETGHCDHPTKPTGSSGLSKPLGRWVTTQRDHKKAGTISGENEAKLNRIGFSWVRKDYM